jgi:hypothetical protein
MDLYSTGIYAEIGESLETGNPFLGVLDLVWKPFLRVPLSAMDNTFDYGLTKATIRAGISDQERVGCIYFF